MMRFPPDFLDEIRARVPISSLIGTRVTFDARKSNSSRGDFWACCPFHREKSPSFHCDDGRGRYHCFGCGASGDIFRFLTELDGISFFDAVEQLSHLAGLPLPRQEERQEEKLRERASLHEVLEKATLFFESFLRQGSARGARDYLIGRGLNEATIRHFRLGYASDSRVNLREHLSRAGIDLNLMERAGLLVTGEDVPVPYDRFRHRIIFPIADLKNRIVGFGGRALSDKARAKYLNSPEGELFHKGHLLYNLSHARDALRKIKAEGENRAPSLIVVEGYMDVIALHQAGIHHAVAPLGTALTDEQLQLLWRTSPVATLCFDGDNAGFKAALRALDRALPLLKTGFSLQFMLLPSGKDPDDIVREGGAEAFGSLLRQALPLADMLWQCKTRGKIFETPESRAVLEKGLTKAIFAITDESLRHYYLQDMRAKLRNLFAPQRGGFGGKANGHSAGRYERGKGQRQGFAAPVFGVAQSNLARSRMVLGPGLSLREAALLTLLANHPSLWEENFDALDGMEFTHQGLERLYQAMLDILAEWQPEDGKAMRELLGKRGQQPILAEIDQRMRELGLRSTMMEAPLEDARTTFKQALHLHLRNLTLHKQLRDIEAELLKNPQSENFSLLREVKAELERTDATQALIEGFGDEIR